MIYQETTYICISVKLDKNYFFSFCFFMRVLHVSFLVTFKFLLNDGTMCLHVVELILKSWDRKGKRQHQFILSEHVLVVRTEASVVTDN